MFWKDGEPFRIIGGDLHYFRTHPEVYFVFAISVSPFIAFDCLFVIVGIITYHGFVSINVES